ncbi:host cell division inhibitor Icd-like protein [Serratia marcescens]|uniref:Host cell division inhibitor Icd-like protein n=1 Tax=Serratia marcescens TaxID=615 RepID=A0ABD6HUJ4_SERMA|nr:host cell division inhibitor Icd-like protein [Serratia marcescens]MDT0205766.1 host cell division inhibitor Icd-like protein [Serratia marcescens]MVF06062.1 host cell division inhibitor Icd-like protein [Serratia marcescens]
MACSHDTQTRPEKTYLWRFIALERSDLKSEPCRLSVEAATEREARRILAPYFILSLAARLPLQGIEKISTPSTIEKTSMEVRYAQA